MPFPHDNETGKALLKALAEMGGEARPKDIYPRVTALLPQLTPADLSRTLKSGDNAWTNRIQFVRQRLVERGELDKTTYGVWRITPKGRQRIGAGSQSPAPVHQQIVSMVQETGRPPLATTHEQIVSMVKEIGERIGRWVTTSEGPEFKHDVVWRRSSVQSPSEVIEVCDSGNLGKDILSLQWATEPRNWGAVGLFVVLDEKERERAKRRLAERQRIYVLSGEMVRQLHAIATRDLLPLLKALFS